MWFDSSDFYMGDSMRIRTTAGLGAGLVLVAGLVAGCSDDGDDGTDGGEGGDKSGSGFADQSYAEIKEAALEAMASLESLHVTADISADEQTSGLDLSMSTEGSCTGTVSYGAASAEVLRTADGGWYKPNADLLAASYPDRTPELIEFVGDSWVVDSEGELTGNNCNLESFVDQLSDDEEETNTEVGEVEKIDGADAVRIDYTNAAGDGSAYVLVDGEHYIVKVERTGDQEGIATFSAFDEAITTEPPAEDEVVDLADFEG